METERADAIVLRYQPVTESSLLVTWFTSECGKLKTLAKGARRPKSPVRGKIDLFYRDEILFLRSKRSDLHLLHDCFLEEPHAKLRDSLPTMAAASYVCELVELATEPEDPNKKIFVLLSDLLTALADRSSPVLLLWFELQLLAAAGWAPRWTAGLSIERVLGSLAGATLAGAQRVRLSESQISEARAALWRFWDAELGRAPRSRKLMAELWTN
jgi:DNA repair protein RecO (recombination protein O)